MRILCHIAALVAMWLEICTSECQALVCRSSLCQDQLPKHAFIWYRLGIQQACKMTTKLHWNDSCHNPAKLPMSSYKYLAVTFILLQAGKLDLTEVEGLADLLAAETEAQRVQVSHYWYHVSLLMLSHVLVPMLVWSHTGPPWDLMSASCSQFAAILNCCCITFADALLCSASGAQCLLYVAGFAAEQRGPAEGHVGLAVHPAALPGKH